MDGNLTETATLVNALPTCASAGMHVHIDQPPGDPLPRLRRLLEAAAAGKLLVRPGYMVRFSPAVVLLREFLAKGRLGEVFEVHSVMSRVIEPVRAPRAGVASGRDDVRLGGQLLDLVVGALGRPTGARGAAPWSAAPSNI